jgi:hypothetical protein
LGGAIDYGTFAYIGLVGVLQDTQRRGIGRAIMAKLLALIDARGGRTSLLDATDAGAALYRKMGSVDDDTVRLFHGEAHGIPTAMARAMLREDLAAVAELDRRIGVADRTALLSAYFDEYEGRAFVVEADGGGIAGFAFASSQARTPPRHRCSSGAGLRPRASSYTCDSASPFPAAATASTDRRSWRRGRGFDREVRLVIPDGGYAPEGIAGGGHPAEGRERQVSGHQSLARRG